MAVFAAAGRAAPSVLDHPPRPRAVSRGHTYYKDVAGAAREA
jgi:hypothetical protein